MISMLVLQPRISTATDWTGINVSVGSAEPGVADVVGDAVSVFVTNVGIDEVMTGVTVKYNVGGAMISGVAVKMGGVFVGGGVRTGNGCGAIPHISQDVNSNPSSKMTGYRFMETLYPARRNLVIFETGRYNLRPWALFPTPANITKR